MAGHGARWRWLYGGMAFVGVIVLIFAGMTPPEQAPLDPNLRPDKRALGLALRAPSSPFSPPRNSTLNARIRSERQ